MQTRLKEQITIGTHTLANRIVMPPMVIWKADQSAEVTQDHESHYRGSAGPGLIIVEATSVSPEGRLAATQLGIFEDRHIAGLSRLAGIIKDGGAVAGIQIHHAGGKATEKTTYGLTPLVPSKSGVPEGRKCREMNEDDIRRVQQDFVAGSKRAVEAGFSYIELHFAHGYLGSQFLSPLTNRRSDKYGGSFENRMRFLGETHRLVKDAVPSLVLVSCRLGVADGRQDGLPLQEGVAAAKMLEDEGMPLLDISACHGVPENLSPAESRFSGLMHLAKAVKQAVKVPVIGVGGVKTADQAENALESGMADLIAVGRGMLADPGWAQKILNDNEEAVSRCIGCKPCFWFKDPEKCPARKSLPAANHLRIF